eukprot:scaffold315604_cov22-Tisochrysis_lutea.AAC.1
MHAQGPSKAVWEAAITSGGDAWNSTLVEAMRGLGLHATGGVQQLAALEQAGVGGNGRQLAAQGEDGGDADGRQQDVLEHAGAGADEEQQGALKIVGAGGAGNEQQGAVGGVG